MTDFKDWTVKEVGRIVHNKYGDKKMEGWVIDTPTPLSMDLGQMDELVAELEKRYPDCIVKESD